MSAETAAGFATENAEQGPLHEQGPLLLRPELRRRPWGGRTLAGLWPEGAATVEAGSGPLGEAWLAGPDSLVVNGPWQGRRLADLAAEHGAALLGLRPTAVYGARMPLLLKLLDAAEVLSVQVHPDDAYALREEAASGHLGKTEAWWVLQAAAGAQVIWGFARPTGADEVRRAVEDGHLEALLRSFEVRPGDVVVNPAGTVHALGGGLLVFEVQQASDLTYRLYDHGRLGADGRPRELHLDKAIAVADFQPGRSMAPEPQGRGAGRLELARTAAFVLEALDAAAAPSWTVEQGSLELLSEVEGGAATLHWRGGRLDLPAWSTCLLPAGLGPVRLQGDGRLARCLAP